MSEILFDATDPDVTSARQTEELRLIEQGGQLIEKQEAEVEEKYRRSELEAQEHSQYAGKFKSAEDLEKAYLELQKKLGQKETDDSSSTEENESDESEPVEEEESPIKQRVSFLKSASEEYYSNDNQLKPETIEKLKEMPSEELIEAYLQLQKDNPVAQSQPLSADAAESIVASVGGQDAYNDTLAWAADNLKPEEVAAYDNVVNSGNKDAIFFAVQALNQRYKDSVGFEGQQVSGKAPKTTVKGFRSNAELAAAISDRRYRTDPAYRFDVEQKLASSGDLLWYQVTLMAGTRKPKLAQSYDLNEPYIPGRQNYKGIPNATPEMLRKLQQKKIKNPGGKETLPPLAKKPTKKRSKTAWLKVVTVGMTGHLFSRLKDAP